MYLICKVCDLNEAFCFVSHGLPLDKQHHDNFSDRNIKKSLGTGKWQGASMKDERCLFYLDRFDIAAFWFI